MCALYRCSKLMTWLVPEASHLRRRGGPRYDMPTRSRCPSRRRSSNVSARAAPGVQPPRFGIKGAHGAMRFGIKALTAEAFLSVYGRAGRGITLFFNVLAVFSFWSTVSRPLALRPTMNHRYCTKASTAVRQRWSGAR